MNKRCIVNVATGDFYCKMQQRLVKSFEKSVDNVFINGSNSPYRVSSDEAVSIDEEPNWNNTGVDLLIWHDILPPGSRPHSESPYGFKVHAIKAAYEKGYTSILWLDSPAYAVKEDISPIFDKIEKEGYYAMSHIDPLENYIGDKSLAVFGYFRNDVRLSGINLPSGSCYGFNLASPMGIKIFTQLLLAEENLLFKDYPPHRHDETLLALIMKWFDLPVFTFDPLFQSDSPECVIKSGGL
jgi:hypothetical protein